jgi:hypothetical protein
MANSAGSLVGTQGRGPTVAVSDLLAIWRLTFAPWRPSLTLAEASARSHRVNSRAETGWC